MECPKCRNRMHWNKDTGFYNMDGFWSCLCGKIAYKTKGVALPNVYHHVGADDRPVVNYINLKKG